MRRRHLVMFLLAGAGVGMAIWLAWPRDREPEYNGRPLSQWALVYVGRAAAAHGPSTAEFREEAEIALRRIGTNALPWLVKWIRPHPWRKQFAALTKKLPPRFRFVDHSFELADAAWLCLYRLGPQAKVAMPELARLLRDTQYDGSSFNVIYFLSRMGKDALPPLVMLLDNPRASNRVAAAEGIGMLDDLSTNAVPAVRALINCLSDPSSELAAQAARSLGYLALEPGLSVPALAKAVHNPSVDVRYEASVALIRFGDQAQYHASPSLLEALNGLDDPRRSVRSDATNVLRYLAPQFLPKQAGR